MPIASDGSTLKWYLSGGAANSDPNASIGGARSSVVVTMDALNNLFDDVAGDEAEAGQDEYRLVYFVNEDTDENGAEDPTIWVANQPHNPNPPYAETGETIEIGIAAAGKNGVETAIATPNTAPAGVTFDDPATKLTGLLLPDGPYLEDDYCGVWLKRATPAEQAYSAATRFVVALEVSTV